MLEDSFLITSRLNLKKLRTRMVKKKNQIGVAYKIRRQEHNRYCYCWLVKKIQNNGRYYYRRLTTSKR